MDNYIISVSKPVIYHMTGKFEALSKDWKHAELNLDDYELCVVTRGVLYLEYNKKQYHIEEGEMLLLPPVAAPFNKRKGYQSSDCSFYWMHFEPQCPVSQSENISLPEYTRLVYPEKIVILMKQLQDAVRNKANSHTLNYMCTAVLCEIYDDIHPHTDDVSETKAARQLQIYEDIVDYVKHNIHSKLTVKQIAEQFGYNEKYISYMFCRISGITLKQFILEQKAETASFFLTDTNLTIQEISAKLGYNDSHNFMRSYKKTTGFSPTEYRNAFSKRVLNH